MAYAPHTNTDVRYARRAGRSLPLVLGGFWVHSGGHRVEYVERDPNDTIWPEYPHRVYVGPRNETRVAKVQSGRHSEDGKKILHRNRHLYEFAPDNPTTHDMLAEHERLVAAAAAARKKAEDYFGTIPRLTEADIAPLIEPPA